MPGFATLAPEVANVTRYGCWLLLGEEEVLVRFNGFPWFRLATIEALTNVDWYRGQRPSPRRVRNSGVSDGLEEGIPSSLPPNTNAAITYQ